MRVVVEKYDPTWAIEFQSAKASLERILKDIPYVSIEHVGSTSIPGLPAKPVLDIDIIIEPDLLPSTRAALVAAGYTDGGEMDIPGRHVYRQPGFRLDQPAHGERLEDGTCRRNTYVIMNECDSLKNHLEVRRILLDDAELREEYGKVKTDLMETEFKDMNGYVTAKNRIIEKILLKARGEAK